MKKFIVILLAIALCCCTFFTVSTEPESFIYLEYVTGNPGRDVAVALSLLSNPGIAALYCKLTYDTDVLTLNEIEDSKLIDDFQYYDNNGTVIISWEPAIENTFQCGQLATLKFTVKQDAPEVYSQLILSNINHGIIDKFGNDVEINAISGTIEIVHNASDIFSQTLAIDNNKNYISAITAGTTVNEILSQLSLTEGISFKNKEILLNSDDIVTTGTKLFLAQNNETVKEYTLIVSGDNSGDGKITVKDLLNLRAEINSPTLTDVYLYASDLNGDKIINEDDFDIIKSHLLHNTEIIGIPYM